MTTKKKKSGTDRCGIKIEANAAPISAKSLQAVAEGFATLLDAGFASHADQATIQAAIRGFAEIASKALIDSTTVSNCNFT